MAAEEKSMLQYDQLMAELKRLCSEKRTGTMFITTSDNHSARFVLSNGDIVSCNYSMKRGFDALPLLKNIKAGSYKFAESLFSSMSEIPLPPTNEFLNNLATPEVVHTPAGAVQSVASDESGLNWAAKAIETELARFLGPIAAMLCEEYLEDDGPLKDSEDVRKMIDTMAAEIGLVAKEKEFIDRVVAKIG